MSISFLRRHFLHLVSQIVEVVLVWCLVERSCEHYPLRLFYHCVHFTHIAINTIIVQLGHCCPRMLWGIIKIDSMRYFIGKVVKLTSAVSVVGIRSDHSAKKVEDLFGTQFNFEHIEENLIGINQFAVKLILIL